MALQYIGKKSAYQYAIDQAVSDKRRSEEDIFKTDANFARLHVLGLTRHGCFACGEYTPEVCTDLRTISKFLDRPLTVDAKTQDGIVIPIDVSKNKEYWDKLIRIIYPTERLDIMKYEAKEWIATVKYHPGDGLTDGRIYGIPELRIKYPPDERPTFTHYFGWPSDTCVLGLYLLYGTEVCIGCPQVMIHGN